MSNIDATLLQEFRRSLEERRLGLKSEIAEKLREARSEMIDSEETTSNDAGDRTFLEQAGELDLAMADRDVVELRELDAAIQRLDEAKFGDCLDCGNAISLARLKAFPAASRCNDCQSIYENRKAFAGRRQ